MKSIMAEGVYLRAAPGHWPRLPGDVLVARSALMAEFQWWLLIVGLVAGGGLVTLVFMDGARLEHEIDERERPAEATWISERLSAEGRDVDPYTAEAVLWAHREYLGLPPPDRIEVEADPGVIETSLSVEAPLSVEPALASDRDADGPSDQEGHDGRGSADGNLAATGEQ
ncbi:MAG: hypothetical protein ACAH65_12835, partial [Chloroflexota bacterium]